MRDNHARDDKQSKHDEPPHSRLFVAHTKRVSEEELREAFGKYGTLEDVWICKDRNSGEPKDIAFIKYTSTSNAACAMEGLNGKILEGHTRPLKVTVAFSRDQQHNQGGKGDDMERLLRLFVVVPKSMTESDIVEEFKQFGEIDYASVVKDRETKESKGYAFVKFTKVSHAAAAFEECDRSFKAVFARPKEQDYQKKMGHQDRNDPFDRSYSSNQSNSYSTLQQSSSGAFMDMPSYSRQNYSSSSPLDLVSGYAGGGRSDNTRLTALVSTQLTELQVERLFDLVPGLNYCRVLNESSSYSRTPLLRRVMLEYASREAASYALEKLHGFEYPPGKKVVVKTEFDQRGDGLLGNVAGKRDAMGLAAAAAANPEISQELATLSKALAEATSIFKMKVGDTLGGQMSQSTDTYDPSLCSVRLPPPQPLARMGSSMEERLFIMGQPSLPPQSALWDVFGRFGNLIEVFLINGKNCGFVNYSKKESADRALEAMHGEEVCHMRLKVTYADPPKTDSRKRIKMDTDN